MTLNPAIFDKNVEQWALLSPKAAVMLPYVNCDDLLFFETTSGDLSLKGKIKEKKVDFHDTKNPKEEAKKIFSNLKIDGVQILYYYGVGLGYLYDAAKPWLKKSEGNHLIFLEDDLAVLHRLLETPQGTKILNDPQVQLYFIKDVKDEDKVLEHLVWSFVTNTIAVEALPVYAKEKKERFDELKHKLQFDTTTKNTAVQEFLGLGDYFFQNFYRNLLHLDKSYYGNYLFGRFAKIPAIICGAGPSLAKQYEKLRGLEDKALIFAGGSSLNALSSQDILPHFGAGVDPFSPQLERLKTNRAFEVPFFYRNRMYHDAFKMVHGPRLFLTGAGGYETPFWFEKKLGLESYDLDEGFNVVNLSVEIAYALGCDPIIFVGMDLAYTDMKSYATGVIADANVTKKELEGDPGVGNQAIVRPDINGRPINTMWKWVAEAQWISDFAKKHPEVSLINATEGGIGFPEVSNKSLDAVIIKHLKTPRDLRSRLHGEIQNSTMKKVTRAKIVKYMKEMEQSLKRAKDHLQILIDESNRLRENIKKTGVVPQELMTGRIALAESDLAEEPGYNYTLDFFNSIYGQLMTQRLKMLRISRGKTSETDLADRKLVLQAEKCMFLQSVAQKNIDYIEDALKKRGKNAR